MRPNKCRGRACRARATATIVTVAIAAVLAGPLWSASSDEAPPGLRAGWKWRSIVPAEKRGDVVVRRECRVTLWTEDGWLIVRRSTIDDELEWQVVLARASDPVRPQVKVNDRSGAIDVSYRGYFIREGGWRRLRVYRERKTRQSPAWPELSLEGERRPLGSGSCAGVSLSACGLDQWCWVQSGPSDKHPDLWLRLQPTTDRPGKASRGGGVHGFLGSLDGPAEMFYGDCDLQDEGDLFVATRTTPDQADQGLDEDEVQQALRTKRAPSLAAAEWLNTDDPPALDKLAGEMVLLYFWSDACPASVQKLKAVQRLHEKFDELVVIGILSARRTEEARRALREHEVSFPVMIDAGQLVKHYRVDALPNCFLIDKAGNVVWGFGMAPPSDVQVEELLK